MTLARGRVLRPEVDASGTTVVPVSAGTPVARGRVASGAIVAAAERAARIVAEAEERARAIVAEASLAAEGARAQALEEARAEGAANVAAAWLALRTDEAARDERDLDKTVGVARIVAERLLGETLSLDPSRIAAIARQALAQARLARRVVIVAHPDDAAALDRQKGDLGLEGAAVEIHADPARARGSLRLDTDLGTLDADLAPQLDRLVAALRDGLRSR